jgi:hypothetical protein
MMLLLSPILYVSEMHLESIGFNADCLTVSLGGVHPSDIYSNAPM